ncbi:MAG: hypothetical protein WBG46_03015 [Nonlabens sp.]
MEYPKQILYDIYWVFDEKHEDLTDFNADLKAYHKAVSFSKLPIDPRATILETEKIVIQFALPPEDEDDDEDDIQTLIEADSPEGFKAGELLFKINNIMMDHPKGFSIADYDRQFFEGLQFFTDDDPDFMGVPVYFLNLGS